MRLLGKIFKRTIREESIETNKFGLVKKDELGFWNGDIVNSSIIGHTVKFSIKAEKFDDGVEMQLLVIMNNYERIYAEIREKMFEGLDDLADGTSMDVFFNSLVFNEIRILDIVKFEWEFVAETSLNDHLFIVQLKDMHYVGFSMDG